MSLINILLMVGIVVFITHALEAVTGFGCAVLAFPFVIAIMGDIEEAKIVLSIIAWMLALYIVITKFRHINWKQYGTIILLAGIGMPIGMLLFMRLDPEILKKILGGFIVISAGIQLYKIFVPNNNIKLLPGFFFYKFLFLGGIIHGAFAVGGPFVVLYATKKLPAKGEFRATLCLLWTVLNTVLMVQYLVEDKLTLQTGKELIVLTPFLIAGIVVGEIIHKKVNEDLFRKLVFFLLLIVGIVMLIY